MSKFTGKLMRKPKVPNKYNLTPAMIPKLKYDRSKIGEPMFWRNKAIDAWCITRNTAKDGRDHTYGTYDGFWLGVYDDDAKSYAGKLGYYFDSYGGICHYKFTKFYDFSQIEYEMDLEIQEKALEVLNQLIDDGVLIIESSEEKED